MGQLDHRDLLERQELPVTLELLETEVQLDQLDQLEHKDQLVLEAKWGQQGTEDLQVTQVHWAHQDLLELQEI